MNARFDAHDTHKDADMKPNCHEMRTVGEKELQVRQQPHARACV
jgi:hypothetical protein